MLSSYGFGNLMIDYDVLSSNDWDSSLRKDNNKKVFYKNIPGKCSDDVSVTKDWNNADQELRLVITIQDDKEPKTLKIRVDTTLYESYSWSVKDGVLKVTLNEIINEEPKFDLVNE